MLRRYRFLRRARRGIGIGRRDGADLASPAVVDAMPPLTRLDGRFRGAAAVGLEPELVRGKGRGRGRDKGRGRGRVRLRVRVRVRAQHRRAGGCSPGSLRSNAPRPPP